MDISLIEIIGAQQVEIIVLRKRVQQLEEEVEALTAIVDEKFQED